MLVARFLGLGRRHPANPLVARQFRQAIPLGFKLLVGIEDGTQFGGRFMAEIQRWSFGHGFSLNTLHPFPPDVAASCPHWPAWERPLAVLLHPPVHGRAVEIFALLIVLALTLGPALIVGLLPWPYWRPVAGWILLPLGLLWLEERNLPFRDLGMFGGIGLVWSKLLIFTIVLAAFVRVFQSAVADRPPPPHWVADWQPPVAILAAVFFFHWLANRLAGWSPAMQPHFIGIGCCTVAAFLLERDLRIRPRRFDLRPFALCFASAMLMLLLYAGWVAMRQAGQAVKEADGRPFCLISYAGSRHSFQATDRWQLSPLVSRRGGRSYLDDGASWLFIDDSVPTLVEREKERADRAEDLERSRWKRDGNTLYRDTVARPPKPIRRKPILPCVASENGGLTEG